MCGGTVLMVVSILYRAVIGREMILDHEHYPSVNPIGVGSLSPVKYVTGCY